VERGPQVDERYVDAARQRTARRLLADADADAVSQWKAVALLSAAAGHLAPPPPHDLIRGSFSFL